MKFQTRGVLKNHKLRVCCFRNWLQNKPCCRSVNSSKIRMVWKAQKRKKNQAICLRDLTYLNFQHELMIFLGLVNQNDKTVTTVFNASSNPSDIKISLPVCIRKI